MSNESPYLFVYGTLRPGSSHPMARYLAERARLLGHARARGRLYDLGPYPGMKEAAGPGEWVSGELYRVLDPAPTLEALDRYEGCGPDHPRPWVFERRLEEVEGPDGAAVRAWVYWYGPPVTEAQRVHSGEYRPRAT